MDVDNINSKGKPKGSYGKYGVKSIGKGKDGCYNCGRQGHVAKECWDPPGHITGGGKGQKQQQQAKQQQQQHKGGKNP